MLRVRQLRCGVTRALAAPCQAGSHPRMRNDHSFSASAVASFSSFHLVQGPPLSFETGDIAKHTHAAVIGKLGNTVVLTTVATETASSTEIYANNNNAFLTVEYRERHHAIGRFPKVRNRKDNRMLSTGEVLASRAIDRALRPILKAKLREQRLTIQSPSSLPLHHDGLSGDHNILRRHVLASLQAMDRPKRRRGKDYAMESGDPISLAINTAAAALDLDVAAVSFGVTADGTLHQDASINAENWIGQLLYAGNEDNCVMMEWGALPFLQDESSSSTPRIGLEDELWPDLLQIAQHSVQERLKTIKDFQEEKLANLENEWVDLDEGLVRASLGLPALVEEEPTESTLEQPTRTIRPKVREEGVRQAVAFCEKHLQEAFLRLFGWTGGDMPARDDSVSSFSVAFPFRSESGLGLLAKRVRGKREYILQEEVSRLTKEFFREVYSAEEFEEGGEEWANISDEVFDRLMRRSFWKSATQYGCRSDGRGLDGKTCNATVGGWNTVRPIKVKVPALPDAVHGSAQFSRGETSVLCTVTLGSPRDGMADQDPFDSLRRSEPEDTVGGSSSDFHALPVGSLRFLRTQEALVSDLNSRKVQAERELTGSTGSLAEFKRAFLQYDFPDYCNGRVPSGGGQINNRRAIGHGALAEKAILPCLPSPGTFPYAIRMTSEVTDSNGSSSMATACGTTLALLDAGVPLLSPVAGISVGLAATEDESPCENALVLDITGNEDHYGAMDFKIAGTRDSVTALQLDVKEPLSPSILAAAIQFAKAGRNVILDEMDNQLGSGLVPRGKPKDSAPDVELVRFDPNRKRDLVGPGGVVLRQLEDRYSVSIDLTQEGRCLLYGEDRVMVSKAKATVMDLVADVEVGQVYEGTIVELKDFGAIVELLRNKEGILHVSELTDDQEAKDHLEGISGFVRDFLKVGQTLRVRVIGVDAVMGTIKLSRKALLRQGNRSTK